MKQLLFALLLIMAVACWLPACAKDDDPAPLELEPTGDALFDRYAEAVYAVQAQNLFTDPDNHPATLDDATLAEWESEFGGDPRYWQLRFWCAYHRAANPMFLTFGRDLSSGSEFDETPYSYLKACIDNGDADWVTLWLYLPMIKHDQTIAMDELMADDDGRSTRSLELQRSMVETIASHEAEVLGWLDRMVELAPDHAWPYYYRAAYWLSIAESDNALADLKLGNKAKLNRLPTSFPASFVIEGLEQGEFRGSQVLCGAVLDAELADLNQRNRTYESRLWLDYAKNISVELSLGGDSGLLDEYHRFACRYGAAGLAYPLEAVIANFIVRHNLNWAMVEQAENYSRIQRGNMNNALFRSQQVFTQRSLLMNELYSSVDDHALLLPYLNLGNVFGGETSLRIDTGRDDAGESEISAVLANVVGSEVYQDLAWVVGNEYELQVEVIRPIFEELAKFSYDMEYPPEGWEIY